MNEFSNASYTMVKMRPILYCVRHGETGLNKAGNFRGWADVPLNDNGRKEAEQVKQDLSDISLSHAYSSDLKRAVETRDIIIKGHNIDGVSVHDMRPWDVGKFTGQPKNAENKKVLQAYADSPDEVIPGGESLNQFRTRYAKVFHNVVDEAKASVANGGGATLMAQHASNCHEVGNILYHDIEVLDVDPGGIIVVSILGNKLSASIFKGAAKSDKPDTVS